MIIVRISFVVDIIFHVQTPPPIRQVMCVGGVTSTICEHSKKTSSTQYSVRFQRRDHHYKGCQTSYDNLLKMYIFSARRSQSCWLIKVNSRFAIDALYNPHMRLKIYDSLTALTKSRNHLRLAEIQQRPTGLC